MTDEKADGKNAVRTRPSMRAAEIRREMRQRPPPSIWTAPQSLAPPPNPAHQVDAKRAETYFRRVTQPHNTNGPPPARDEHVFMPIRRLLRSDQFNPMTLSKEEKQWAHNRGLEVKPHTADEHKIV